MTIPSTLIENAQREFDLTDDSAQTHLYELTAQLSLIRLTKPRPWLAKQILPSNLSWPTSSLHLANICKP
jgi:hypothetical protein